MVSKGLAETIQESQNILVTADIFADCCLIADICGINDWSVGMDAQNNGFVASADTCSVYKDAKLIIAVDKSANSFLVQDVASKMILLGRKTDGVHVGNANEFRTHEQYIHDIVAKIK